MSIIVIINLHSQIEVMNERMDEYDFVEAESWTVDTFCVGIGSLKFDVIDDTNLLEITSPFPMMIKDRVVKSEKVIESVLDILKPAFSWISATGKLYKFSSLDEETIMEYFSDMFDDSEDYSVHVKETMGINLYEIAVSTKTIHKGDEGGFIFIDEDVMGLFRDLPNVIRHIQSEYPVNISINTSRPNRDRHPDKSETFYKSQAFILRVVPTISDIKPKSTSDRFNPPLK